MVRHGVVIVDMNVEGQRENFYGQTLQREGGAAESSAGGSVAAAAPCEEGLFLGFF